MNNRQAKHFYEFGPFRVDVTEQLLLRDGVLVPLTPKAFDTLLILAENSGHLVEKEELMKRLWPNTFVEEANLAHNISLLRKAFGENPDKYIQTVPRRGYRFLGDVKESWEGNQPNAHEAEEPFTQPSDTQRQARDKSEQVQSQTIETQNVSAPTSEDGRTDGQTRLSSRSAVRLAALLTLAILITAILVYVWRRANPAIAQPPIRSLAVLPLENRSGDAAQDYFADGMTEELNTQLAKVGTLRVISRSSTMQYKGTRKSLSEIARELNVDAIVEGSVWRSGERVRINTQLYSAATGQNLWANSYERDLRDVLSLQGEVARGIVAEIKIKLTPWEQASLSRARPINPEAENAYLRGLDYFNHAANNPAERRALVEKSVVSYQQAIKIEPGYARAYAALADAYALLEFLTNSLEYYAKAKEAALTAIRLDDTDGGAHAALAGVLWNYDWDAAGAEKEYRRAIELDPNTSRGGNTLYGYALFLASLGRHEEAIREIRLAEENDPLNLNLKTNVGNIYFNARQFDRALEKFKSLSELHPDFFTGGFALARIYTYKGLHEEAIAEMQKSVARSKGNPTIVLDLAWVYALAGRRSEATGILDEFKRLSTPATGDNVAEMKVAQICAALGDKEQAFIWLEKRFAAHARALRWLKTDPPWDNLRSDPRFQVMLRRRGFPP